MNPASKRGSLQDQLQDPQTGNQAEVPCEMAFVFRATATETGVLMLTRHMREEDFAGSVFGRSVDPVIFPD